MPKVLGGFRWPYLCGMPDAPQAGPADAWHEVLGTDQGLAGRQALDLGLPGRWSAGRR